MSTRQLKHTCSEYIARMTSGESLVRVGHLWYGTDGSTVTGLYYFSNKQVETLPGLRADAAIAFAKSNPPVDTLRVELVVSYSHFSTMIQELFAMLQITPIIPVMNPAIAALTQPIDNNRDIYLAYGYDPDELVVATDSLDAQGRTYIGGQIPSFRRLMEIYSSVPIQMRVDVVRLESIDQASRDVRILLQLTRVLTANSYGDRVLYLETMDDALMQEQYVRKIETLGGDNEQIYAAGEMLGLNARVMQRMIDVMQKSNRLSEIFNSQRGSGVGTLSEVSVEEVITGDMFAGRDAQGESALYRILGVESHCSPRALSTYYGLSSALAPPQQTASGVSVVPTRPSAILAYSDVQAIFATGAYQSLCDDAKTRLRNILRGRVQVLVTGQSLPLSAVDAQLLGSYAVIPRKIVQVFVDRNDGLAALNVADSLIENAAAVSVGTRTLFPHYAPMRAIASTRHSGYHYPFPHDEWGFTYPGSYVWRGSTSSYRERVGTSDVTLGSSSVLAERSPLHPQMIRLALAWEAQYGGYSGN